MFCRYFCNKQLARGLPTGTSNYRDDVVNVVYTFTTEYTRA